MSDAHPPLRTFGRIKSRPIKPRQAALLETLLPTLRPPEGAFDPRELMAGAAEA
jgi:tRNA (guanine-N7-)-methyltransferase